MRRVSSSIRSVRSVSVTSAKPQARRGALAPRLAAGALLGAMVGALLLGAVGGSGLQSQALAYGPRCLFLAATGAPCPFCGMTRATFAMGAGDLGAALEHHPLAPLVLAAVAALCAMIVAGKTAWISRRKVAVALWLALAAVWLWRLAA